MLRVAVISFLSLMLVTCMHLDDKHKDRSNESQHLEHVSLSREELALPILIHGAPVMSNRASEEPLIRCKRPMCEFPCPRGYETDSRGCPTCGCKEASCSETVCPHGEICKETPCPENDEICNRVRVDCITEMSSPSDEIFKQPCPMPMCANYCPGGYANDADGCMTCKCKDGSMGKCPMYKCVPCEFGYGKDANGCQTCECLTAENGDRGIAVQGARSSVAGREQCPKFKCMSCEFGYEKDAQGCQTCRCLDSFCVGITCSGGQSCSQTVDCSSDGECRSTAVCSFRSLCVHKRHLRDGGSIPSQLSVNSPGFFMGVYPPFNQGNGFTPECARDGSFKSLQCRGAGQCFCVDDRGVEIASMIGDRVCPIVHMTRVDVTFTMTHPLDVQRVVTDDERLVTYIREKYLRRWLLIDKRFITNVTVTRRPTLDSIGFTVTRDRSTDLASSVNHLYQLMMMMKAPVKYFRDGPVMNPTASSLLVTPFFQEIDPPLLPEEGLRSDTEPSLPSSGNCFYRFFINNRLALIVGIVTCSVMIAVVVSLIVRVVNRRKAIKAFFHKPMSNYHVNLTVASEASDVTFSSDDKQQLTEVLLDDDKKGEEPIA